MKAISEGVLIIIFLLCVNTCATCSVGSKLDAISAQLKERLP